MVGPIYSWTSSWRVSSMLPDLFLMWSPCLWSFFYFLQWFGSLMSPNVLTAAMFRGWGYWVVSRSQRLWSSQWINSLIGSKLNGPIGRWQTVGCGTPPKGVGPWGHALGDYILSPTTIFLPLLPGCREVKHLLNHTLPALKSCFTTGPESTEPSDHQLKSWVKISLSSFKLIFSAICHSNEKLTHIVTF